MVDRRPQAVRVRLLRLATIDAWVVEGAEGDSERLPVFVH